MPLETDGDDTSPERLLTSTFLRKPGIVYREVTDDEGNLDRVGSPVAVLLGFLVVRRVEALALAEVLPCPGQCPLVLFDAIDLLAHAASELAHIDVLVVHAQVLGLEPVFDREARDAHRDRPYGQVGVSLYLDGGRATDGIVEQSLSHFFRDGSIVGVLHMPAVNAEGGDT